MKIRYAILGLVIGVFVASSGWGYVLGAVGGAVFGLVLARLASLERRLEELESTRHPVQKPSPEIKVDQSGDDTPIEASPWSKSPPYRPWADMDASELITDSGKEAIPVESPGAAGSIPSPRNWPAASQQSPGAFLLEQGINKATAWFTSGNVPVKIGVIVTFIGVSFLLKYAIDRELIFLPLEFRLLLVAVAGLALTIVGWRLREKMRSYALSLQGGGIGILFLTIFAAFRLWQLLPASLTFVLLVVLAVLTGALAVLQNARILALFGIVGGFLAPVLTSTGQGSHVVLFSYQLLLNGAILGISWFRSWRELNIAGFIFTFVIGSLWGYQFYKPELMNSTMPFLLLHFLFYQMIAILFAFRQPPERIGLVDGTLVFGTPVISFALQAAMLHETEYGLAISAAVAAVFYALVSVWLLRRKGHYMKLLMESFIALAVVCATITIPLALDARWTSAAWAAEGAALVWVGARQGHLLPKLAGTLLIFMSGAAFFKEGWHYGGGLAVLNGNFLGGLLISLSALFTSRQLQISKQQNFEIAQKTAYVLLFLWGGFWWLATGLMETMERVSPLNGPHVYLLFLAISMTTAAWLGQAREWAMLRRTSLVLLLIMLLTAMLQVVLGDHFLRELGWLVWPFAWAAQVYILRINDRHETRNAAIFHIGSLMLLTAMLALEVAWWVGQVVSNAWAAAAATVVTGIVALLVWRCRDRPAWPVPAHPAAYFKASLVLVAIQVISLLLLCIYEPGNPAPLAYIPVLNPFDLASVFAIFMATLSLAVIRREAGVDSMDSLTSRLEPYKWMLAAAVFVLTTIALVRGVHHITGVAWRSHTLFNSVVVQTSLSIYWGLLGFAGMIWGARSKRRLVWVSGAGFMALVIVKLFLVDLGNTGTVERIISFLGIGALLLVVGYFAPAPPRNDSEKEKTQDTQEETQDTHHVEQDTHEAET